MPSFPLCPKSLAGWMPTVLPNMILVMKLADPQGAGLDSVAPPAGRATPLITGQVGPLVTLILALILMV